MERIDAGKASRLLDGGSYCSTTRYLSSTGKIQMPRNHGCPSDAATLADARRAGNSDTGGDGSVLSYLNIARHHNLVIQLDSGADNSRIRRSTINSGIGPDF